VVKQVKADFQTASVTPKLKALLTIAGKVQRGGKNVTGEDVAMPAIWAQPTSRFMTPC